ncbi:hypothetical protein [Mesorhizobium sp. M7A.F.Ce.TU.012.03.2.1]|uniref:phosphoribosyltransferase-like protein n=1 Tax=Mesorhizobium sp. M7A.F.Ce.TU.012.03.2.1 TaxID=2493681 RepID=UPI000FDAA782|nr:hypothetical protein [Mesorhizobium sp. M7A.F.Ce.TU.012.03.2.1]AZV20640.1 hypothetical protein EJ079_17155 [Mesorhizobium sp. M7A.F.Ce.TU.012.03.2.1]
MSEYDALVRLWNDCHDAESRDLIIDLVNNFKVITSFDMVDITKSVSAHVQEKWSLSAKNTIFFAVSDDHEADGSQAFLQQLKNDFSSVDGWSEKNFRNSLVGYSDAFGNGKNYVLFDDFFGTGKTIERQATKFVEYVKNSQYKDNRVYLLAIAGMAAAKSRLDGLGLDYHSEIWLNRGISDRYEGADVSSKRKIMKSLEKNLAAIYKGQFMPSMGYGSSEALFSVHNHNCPNNVFPIFWWPVYKDYKPRKTIFKRLR